MSNSDWREVTKAAPCPVCGKPDWCGRTQDEAVRCMRVSEPPSGWRVVKKCEDGGTVFTLDNGPRGALQSRELRRGASGRDSNDRRTDRDWAAEHARYVAALTPERLQELANGLSVRADALQAIGIGWYEAEKCHTFPERDAGGRIIGINRRYSDGSKKAFYRSKRGLTVPDGFPSMSDPVLVVEGGSDTAACLTVGLSVVGRSNAKATAHLAELLSDRDCIVVGENDQKPEGAWPGRDGARTVGKHLAKVSGRPVRWALPPGNAKDVRSWLQARGLDLNDAEACEAAGRVLLDALEASATVIAAPKTPTQRPDSQATQLVALCADLHMADDAKDGEPASTPETLPELPFKIETHIVGRRGTVQYIAIRDGKRLAGGKYAPLDTAKRDKLAERWAANKALQNDGTVTVEAIRAALEEAELAALDRLDEVLDAKDSDDEAQTGVECASYVTKDHIVELAWNYNRKEPDFIIYDRKTHTVSRPEEPIVDGVQLFAPGCSPGIVTPGGRIGGSVLVPSEYDETGFDEDRLRHDVECFIRRYVEFSDDTTMLCVEYIFLTWVHDGFDEVPYLAFRTADIGRGKSRALEVVGAVCYRPILCGGGSTSAATLRLLHHFGGTLLADEFDQRDTELAAELTKIINQGFQQNRPLVRCEGEGNNPKPFRCFGPKVFALRKGFADEATESRIISIHMRQRTRKDIPICLPRAQFDRAAMALRNRLLAWRFANLGKITVNPVHADRRLEDRNNQIGLPLMAVAGDRGRDRIVRALLEQQRTIAADRADSLPGDVLATVLQIGSVGGTVRPKDLANTMNEGRAKGANLESADKLPKDQRIRPEKVGRILRTVLELPRGRDGAGVFYTLEAGRIESLCRRFGVSPRKPTRPTDLHPAPEPTRENPLFDTENADSVGPVGNAGFPETVGDVSGGPTDGDSDRAEREDIQAIEAEAVDPPQTSETSEGQPSAETSADMVVPDGWQPPRWADELDRKASTCELLHPELAVEYRRQAAAIREQEPT